jgi:hypothetical protein
LNFVKSFRNPQRIFRKSRGLKFIEEKKDEFETLCGKSCLWSLRGGHEETLF